MMRYICYAVPWYATADKKLSSTALRLRLAMESQPPLSVPEMAKLINSLSYLDNARPAFLRNVLTRGRMEYDRYYYAHKAAFEFNGPQHYRTTGQRQHEGWHQCSTRHDSCLDQCWKPLVRSDHAQGPG